MKSGNEQDTLVAKYRKRQAQWLRYYQDHKERYHQPPALTWRRTYYLAHREVFCQRSKVWREEHHDKVIENNRRRRAHLLGVESTFNLDDYELLYILQEGRCAYCNCDESVRSLGVEHMTPLIRGGAHSLANVVLACVGPDSCNSSKHSKTVAEYIHYLELHKGQTKAAEVASHINSILTMIATFLNEASNC